MTSLAHTVHVRSMQPLATAALPRRPNGPHSTFLHVPSLDLVVSGDVVYNQVHQYLSEAGDHGIDAWLDAIDAVAALAPTTVVAEHKNPEQDDPASVIDDTRDCLRTH
ncbi:hypothetical protein JCM4814A_01000 [Streptomyces phaeofaciens JCM 4814]|uniref:Uncharacterized protein n=1 Tax=Streptomyces phaeofaciens TaxID=68254 RepID=A0A918M1D3_9ACTN|nr:hypothetical protein [Streptomyces phaeofaciens]GGT92078.1 hypothetical protein GCM10010226_82580 [Streptomyces phaeofaciens]